MGSFASSRASSADEKSTVRLLDWTAPLYPGSGVVCMGSYVNLCSDVNARNLCLSDVQVRKRLSGNRHHSVAEEKLIENQDQYLFD